MPRKGRENITRDKLIERYITSYVTLGQWGYDELINSFELIEVYVTKCYDFGRPYTTDPPIKEANKISTGP
jgi:hypothetical protein